MRVLHLAAGNRWTGAAAPAFAEVAALRAAGADAHYAYVGGYKLEAKLREIEFAHPLIEKAQNPAAFFRTVNALSELARSIGADFIHAHLTYDHWLARFVAARSGTRLARTFHSRRVLRNDPFTHWLTAKTDLVFAVNDTFAGAPLLRRRDVVFTPPPVDLAQFRPDGANVRALYGIADETPLVAMIGKLSKDRGFECGLQAFAKIRAALPDTRMMIIGHGEHRPALERLASDLGIAAGVVWAGYHEDDLADHYRAADTLLFTAAGSDEGHRAVLEVMACGVPPVAAPLEGMAALLPSVDPPLISGSDDADVIAATAIGVLAAGRPRLHERLLTHVAQFGPAPAAKRLLEAYASRDRR